MVHGILPHDVLHVLPHGKLMHGQDSSAIAGFIHYTNFRT